MAPRTLPAPPPYGVGTLSDVLPGVLASLGVPVLRTPSGAAHGAEFPLDLPSARAACVLLVDGLGARLLAAAADAAPRLAALARNGRTLRAGFPSTTATSLGSLTTGLPPGAHGLLGLKVAVPEQGRLLHLLRWGGDGEDPDPLTWQPRPTAFEQAVAEGVAAYAVVPRSFDGTGLTGAVLRGATLCPAESAGERVAAALGALRTPGRSLVYAYYGDLDATGHRAGWQSEAWRLQLGHVERLVLQLAERLPPDTALHVVADHGMVDLDPAQCVDVAARPELRDGVALLAGEARARYVHAVPGAAHDVLAAWREVLGNRADVLARDEAVARGWFGPSVSVDLRGRIGDVVAAARDRAGVLDTAAEPWESRLVGQHGSLTDEEQDVPLLTVEG